MRNYLNEVTEITEILNFATEIAKIIHRENLTAFYEN